MYNGAIATMEKISALLYGISTVVNTIDYFITLLSNIIGMFTKKGEVCCTSGMMGACKAQATLFNGWHGLKDWGFLQAITDFATCACCSGGAKKEGGGRYSTTGTGALRGGALGMCPLGALSNAVSGSDEGIGRFELNAFDNIYTAVGCLCPIAILHNLRKLKKIYEVHNCCVKQACMNGISTESCERQ